MTEPEKARRWRERHGLNRQELSDLCGYGVTAIYWMEEGKTPPGNNGPTSKKIKPHVWLRYRRACQGVDHELRTKRKFNW